jgi:hypothetical protein
MKNFNLLSCKHIGTCRCEAVYFRRSSLPRRLGDCFAAQTAASNDKKVGLLIFATEHLNPLSRCLGGYKRTIHG